jgi:hypothetical protein
MRAGIAVPFVAMGGTPHPVGVWWALQDGSGNEVVVWPRPAAALQDRALGTVLFEGRGVLLEEGFESQAWGGADWCAPSPVVSGVLIQVAHYDVDFRGNSLVRESMPTLRAGQSAELAEGDRVCLFSSYPENTFTVVRLDAAAVEALEAGQALRTAAVEESGRCDQAHQERRPT